MTGTMSKFVRTYRSRKDDAIYAVVRTGDGYAVVLYLAGYDLAPVTLRRFERGVADGGREALSSASKYARDAAASGRRESSEEPDDTLLRCVFCSTEKADPKYDPYCSAQCSIGAENDSRERD